MSYRLYIGARNHSNERISLGYSIRAIYSTPRKHHTPQTTQLVSVSHATHIVHCNQNGWILIRTVDTDVVVLAIAAVQHLSVSELRVAFGVGKHIPAHTIAHNLGTRKCQALPEFHAITGCDTVSSFSKNMYVMRGCNDPLSLKLS